MSATLDANILVYASNQSDPVYPQAIQLVTRLATGPDLLYLFWPVVLGYLRIVTHPAILPKPLSARDATANAEALFQRPHVRTPGEADGFWELFRQTSRDQARGNDVPDAHLIALMRQHGVRRIYSRDIGLRRYGDVDVVDPFAPPGGGRRSRRFATGSSSSRRFEIASRFCRLNQTNYCRLGEPDRRYCDCRLQPRRGYFI